jgi:CRISPR-associated exonuclease Cas4
MSHPQTLLLLGLLATLLLALWAWRRAGRLRGRAGLPDAPVVYSDTGRRERGALLRSARHGLYGRPDYILYREGSQIPVELKSARAVSRPYHNDVLQLAAYCLLVSEAQGRRVPYGLLRYGEATFSVPYTPELEEGLLETLAAMRAAVGARSAPDRSHNVPARCRRCGLRSRCGQGLGE